MTPADLDAALAQATDIARAAGAFAHQAFQQRTRLLVEEKGAQDYVSAADRDTEALIVRALRDAFPQHGVLGEEGAKEAPEQNQPLWVIDPIDGTTNFLHGIALYAVSVGLVVDGVPVAGVIHVPELGETFTARTGGGAFMNGVPIHCAGTTSLARATVGIGSSGRTPPNEILSLYESLTRAGVEVRRLGSACVHLAAVACGRIDGYVEPHLNAWDVAAGLVLLQESGADEDGFTQGAWLTRGGRMCAAAPGVFHALQRFSQESARA